MAGAMSQERIKEAERIIKERKAQGAFDEEALACFSP